MGDVSGCVPSVNNLAAYLQGVDVQPSSNITSEYFVTGSLPSSASLRRVWQFTTQGTISGTSTLTLDYTQAAQKCSLYNITFEGALNGTLIIHNQTFSANKYISYALSPTNPYVLVLTIKIPKKIIECYGAGTTQNYFFSINLNDAAVNDSFCQTSSSTSTCQVNPPTVATGTKVVACLGDSITQGGYGDCPDGKSCYETYLCDYLVQNDPSQKYAIFNYGVGGTTQTTLGQFNYAYDASKSCESQQTKQYTSYRLQPIWSSISTGTLPYAPDIFIIMFGTNDSQVWNWACETNTTSNGQSQFVFDYQNMIQTIQNKYPNATLFIMRPPPAGTSLELLQSCSFFNLAAINYPPPTGTPPETPGYSSQTPCQTPTTCGSTGPHANEPCCLQYYLDDILAANPLVKFIDLWSPFIEKIGTTNLADPTKYKPYLCDGIHPSKQGNQLIGNVVGSSILSLKK